MNEADKVRRGERARQLLKDPLIAEAIEGMRKKMYDAIESSKFKDEQARLEAYYMLRTISLFEKSFAQMVNDGKMAKGRLEGLSKAVKRVQEL